jgi:hypothetical protein
MSNLATFNPSKVPAFARNNVLSDNARALAGSATVGGGKRVSIRGGVFRLLSEGKEVASIEERHLDVIIVKAAPKVSRQYYAAAYNPDAAASAPDCTSADGETPDFNSKAMQSASCANCPQNVAGSGNGSSRACKYQHKLAVVLESDPEGDVMQLILPAGSIFGKADGDKRPLQAYARYLASQNPPINPEQIVTRMKFDTSEESPTLVFQPARWLTDDEYAISLSQGKTPDAERAIGGGIADVAAPLQMAGKRPMGELTKEEDAPKYAPIVEKATRAKAKPKAEVVEEDESEPEVRKAAPAQSAVPVKSSKLASIVSDWDDE